MRGTFTRILYTLLLAVAAMSATAFAAITNVYPDTSVTPVAGGAENETWINGEPGTSVVIKSLIDADSPEDLAGVVLRWAEDETDGFLAEDT